MSLAAATAAHSPFPAPGLRRFLTVFSGAATYHARRPLFWIWAAVLVLGAWGMSTGTMTIQSGDASVGGTKAWITSEFAVAKQLSILTLILYAFFLAIAAGMTIIQDAEWRLGDLLHATSLTPGEYVWGKFAAVLVCTLGVLAIHLLAMVFCFHVLPGDAAKDIRGPFHALNYIRPALVFSLPTIVFLAGTSLAIGEWTRRPILVFIIPLALLMVDLFVWSWSPGWLDPRINRAMMLIEPGGFRWLNETWLKVDRGVSFYNTAAIPYDRTFLLSRLVFILLGLGAVSLSRKHFASTLRGHSSLASGRASVSGTKSCTEFKPPAMLTRSALFNSGAVHMRGRKPEVLTILPPDFPELERIARSDTLPWYQVRRARIVLEIATGQRREDLASQLECDDSTIWRTCQRYRQLGLVGLLSDDRHDHSGRDLEITPVQRAQIVRTGLPGTRGQRVAYHSLVE